MYQNKPILSPLRLLQAPIGRHRITYRKCSTEIVESFRVSPCWSLNALKQQGMKFSASSISASLILKKCLKTLITLDSHLSRHHAKKLFKLDGSVAIFIKLVYHRLQLILGWIVSKLLHDGSKLWPGAINYLEKRLFLPLVLMLPLPSASNSRKASW